MTNPASNTVIKSLVSPIGEFQGTHLSTPDRKYSPEGIYKVDLILSGSDAQQFKKEVDEAVEAVFTYEGKKLPLSDRRKAQRYHPYEVTSEEAGNDSGAIRFRCRQRAKTVRDGRAEDVVIPIFDSANNLMERVEPLDGTRGRLALQPRAVVLKVRRPIQIGVHLGIIQVQIVELKDGGKFSPVFDVVDGGFAVHQDNTPRPAG